MEAKNVGSVEEFVGQVRDISQGWQLSWFRGEPDKPTRLLPRLYRPHDGPRHDENNLLQFFRMKAPTVGGSLCPDREATDQWLFLAQHVGLPTRLLDWTESALVALYFAISEGQPIVWMLNPIGLNLLTDDKPFGLTWVPGNSANENVRGAWEHDSRGVELPLAIYPTHLHPRMSVQRSCFTIQGKNKTSLADQAPAVLARLQVDPGARISIRRDLRQLGISQSTVFPDLDGLATDLAEVF